MFENDKGKGIFMRKKKCTTLFCQTVSSESLECAKFTYAYYY